MWLIFVLGFIFIFLYIQRQKNYFKYREIPYFKSSFPFGIFTKVAFKYKSVYENIFELYNEPSLKDEPFYGFHLFHQPALLIKDLNLIKLILVKDFEKFPVRYAGSDHHDPLGDNFIFFTKDVKKRRLIRAKISPFFTGSRLKFSFHHIQDETSKFLRKKYFKKSQVELDLLATFKPLLVNIIGNLALGIDASKSDGLHRAIRSIFESSFKRDLEFGAFFGFPKIMKYFDLKLFGKYATNYFSDIIPEIIQLRKINDGSRKDFIDYLIKIKNETQIEDEFLDVQVMMFIGGGEDFTV